MLTLYALSGCPYCTKVRDKLNELRIKFDEIMITKSNKPEIVIKLGGTVPVIDDDGHVMNESADIVKYLEEKYDR